MWAIFDAHIAFRANGIGKSAVTWDLASVVMGITVGACILNCSCGGIISTLNSRATGGVTNADAFALFAANKVSSATTACGGIAIGVGGAGFVASLDILAQSTLTDVGSAAVRPVGSGAIGGGFALFAGSFDCVQAGATSTYPGRPADLTCPAGIAASFCRWANNKSWAIRVIATFFQTHLLLGVQLEAGVVCSAIRIGLAHLAFGRAC